MNTIVKMTENEIRFVGEAAREWRAMKNHCDFNRYMKIGAALGIGRRVAMLAAGTNDINATTYKRAFSQWCADNGFGDMDPATRANLLYLQEGENRTLCDLLRKQMGEVERRRVNHPAAMVRRIRAYKRKRDAKARPRKTLTVDQHDQIIADFEERLAPVDIDPAQIAVNWFLGQPTDHIARVYVANDRTKAEILAESLRAAISQHDTFDWTEDEEAAS